MHAYTHDFYSEIKEQLKPEIERFQRVLRRLHWFGRLSRFQSKFVNALMGPSVARYSHRRGLVSALLA